MQGFFSFFKSFSPIKTLFQYVFKRLIGNYVLTDIDFPRFFHEFSVPAILILNIAKFNETLFKNSNFALQSGFLHKVQLKIPWKALLTQSIEISIEEISAIIKRKPVQPEIEEKSKENTENTEITEENKEKNENSRKKEENSRKNENNEEKKENSKEKEGKHEENRKDSDVFKRIVNKILQNIKVNIKKISIIYKETEEKQQFLLETTDFSLSENPTYTINIADLSLFLKGKTENSSNSHLLLKTSAFTINIDVFLRKIAISLPFQEFFLTPSVISQLLLCLHRDSLEKSSNFSNSEQDCKDCGRAREPEGRGYAAREAGRQSKERAGAF